MSPGMTIPGDFWLTVAGFGLIARDPGARRGCRGRALSGLEPGDDRTEAMLLGTGRREGETHPPGIAGDHGADLQQPEAEGSALRASHPGPLEAASPDGVEQKCQPRPASNQRNGLDHHRWHEVRSAKSWSCCSLLRFSLSPRAQESFSSSARPSPARWVITKRGLAPP